MTEKLRTDNNEMHVVKRHYSEKGGHFERGQYWRNQQRLEASLPDLCCRRLSPQPIPVEIAWRIRRTMLRDPQDGR